MSIGHGLCVLAAASPARRPKTSRSDRELPPSRFAPWKSRRGLARSEESGTVDFAVSRLDANSSHHVMTGGTDFHGAGGDVHIREFFELVIHARQFFLHILGGLVGDIEIRAAVLSAAAFADLGVNGTRHHVARGKFHSFRDHISP